MCAAIVLYQIFVMPICTEITAYRPSLTFIATVTSVRILRVPILPECPLDCYGRYDNIRLTSVEQNNKTSVFCCCIKLLTKIREKILINQRILFLYRVKPDKFVKTGFSGPRNIQRIDIDDVFSNCVCQLLRLNQSTTVAFISLGFCSM